MSNDAPQSGQAKVHAIFHEAFGDHAARLFSPRNVAPVMDTVCEAFASELPPAPAEALGFHMADWARDAAFVIAIHLFRERFTPEEIREATHSLAAHVPYHVSAVADLLGYPEIEPFKVDDEDDTHSEQGQEGAKP